ncbi:MAG: YdcH family protein [Pseudomonadota bacterium]
MSHVPHELAEEFPHMQEEIHKLKTEDAHFQRLFDEYHTLNRAIHRAETNVEPTDDGHLTEMRKERLRLKDEIATCLAPS